jgi:hypothetical protein
MRIPLPFSKAASVVILSALLLPATHAAWSQPGAKTAPVAAAAPTDEDLANTREQLLALLRTTPTLTQVLETDPSLLADQDYVTRNNPQLAQYLAQHPEVTRNPDFYLFADIAGQRGRRIDSLHRRINGYAPRIDDAERRWQLLQNIVLAMIFIAGMGALLWLIRILLENRRWTRLFRLQSEIHSKLIDRFASNQELLSYMETEPGKRFLEAAPIPIAFERDQRLPGGLTRILGPLQIGIVMTLLGTGLLILEHKLSDRQHGLSDLAGPLLVFGMVALMSGLGFIISAIVAWRISERLGLMPQPAPPSTELSDRQ